MNAMNNEKGFSLIEALMATAILSIGIITLITMQTTSVKGNAKARGITTAATLAQDKIEELINTDFDGIVDGNEPSTDGHFDITWTINQDVMLSDTTTPVPLGNRPVKEIQITVTRDDFGLQRAVSFTYYRQKTY
ncbi:MAG: prepilin-type N-terminal cleavage/methylation domain-containing protein [Desulfobulbaceae bacterium]|nr:prepilin-type N-terminal cleavage/methylation domain-containing protein [Desulfobulbaceae bacterium]